MSTNASFVVRGAAAGRAVPFDVLDRSASDQLRAIGPWADELDESRRAANADGFASGRAEGYDAGRRQAEEAVAQQLQRHAAAMERLVGAAQVELDRLAAQLAERSVTMAIEIAALILDREVTAAEDPGGEAIARCLDIAPRVAELTARLHPEQAAALGPTLQEGDRRVEIVADPTLAPGDAMIHADDATVDGRISTALARVAEVLR